MFGKIFKKAIGENYDIVPPQLAITAMRSSGFRSTDNAVAELIDNSIQSGIENGKKTTNVEVLCIEEIDTRGERNIKRISEIAVYDDAAGMDRDTLRFAMMFGVGARLNKEQQKGIGKFGMGLPNSSISQCRHVDVYSWQNGEVLKTYLDIDEIQSGLLKRVPEPEKSKIPPEWEKLIKSSISDSGTLVVWSNLDRTSWVQHKAFFNNTEFLIGRIYRYFIKDGRAKIRLAAFSRSGGSNLETLSERFVRANDPLMLMTDTMAPKPYNKEPAFIEFHDPEEILVTKPDGTSSTITITYSLVKQEVRKTEKGDAGNSPIGKFVARNLGVSVVRAGRELELNTTWNDPTLSTERWWSIVISFEPELDEILGVSNNKQAANNLFKCDVNEDARNEGLKVHEYLDNLSEAMDPRQINYRISASIAKKLSIMKSQIKKQRLGDRTGDRGHSNQDDAESISSRATEKRREKTGITSESDVINDETPKKEQVGAVAEELIEGGVEENTAKRIAIKSIDTNTRYFFIKTELSSSSIFDITQNKGNLFIKLNTKHPAHEHLIELLEEDDTNDDSPTLKGLKILLTAWTRMEDEATGQLRENLQDIRINWGRMARDFFYEDTGEGE